MINNETVGISAEIAICDAFGVECSVAYRDRGNDRIVNNIRNSLERELCVLNIPKPIEHIAEGQNPVDFMLCDGSTLSVKTNQKQMGKVAPQNVGQATSQTHFKKFEALYTEDIPNTYEKKVELFKRTVIDKIDKFMEIYWDNLFDCDYLLYISGILNNNIQFNIYNKSQGKKFIRDGFTFTQTQESWNESNTVKYNGVSIGEFQVHNNRDCFKFRFIMGGINKLLQNYI